MGTIKLTDQDGNACYFWLTAERTRRAKDRGTQLRKRGRTNAHGSKPVLFNTVPRPGKSGGANRSQTAGGQCGQTPESHPPNHRARMTMVIFACCLAGVISEFLPERKK